MAQKRVGSVGELKNVYLIYGDEELLMEDAVKRLKEFISSEVDPEFNLEVLNASEIGVERIIDSAETVPLLSNRRLVIARDIDRLSRGEQERLADYLENPNPDTTLVLVAHFPATGEKHDPKGLDKIEKSRLFKQAKQAGEVLKLSLGTRGRKPKLESWVSDQFKRRGKAIDPAARDVLIEKVGRELRDLDDAVERICLYRADDDTIGIEEVRQVVFPVAEQGIFELIDAVAERRRDVSLYLLNRLVRQGESPQHVFNLLLRQFRLVSRVKALAEDHDYRDIASQVAIPPFLVSKCLQQAKRFSSDRLRSIFLHFKDAMSQMHSSKYLSEGEYQTAILEILITRIIG